MTTPNLITMRGNYQAHTDLDHDMGLYAQDRWTMSRLTVAGAIRFDWFKTSFPEQTLGPVALAPNRNITFPAADNISWKDLTYRSGFSYDIFGTGQDRGEVQLQQVPAGPDAQCSRARSEPGDRHRRRRAARAWNDANRDFIPQCDLTNLLANGECAQASNLAFGTAVQTEQFDPDLIGGFNHRQTNWETSVSVVHELMPRVGLDVGYFRRSWANFRVTDNLAVTPADYTTYDIVNPVDPRLGEDSGATVRGFVDVVPAKFGQVRNYNTLSTKVGDMSEVWQGVDITVNARLQNGLNLQGGVSTGSTHENDCDIMMALPETATFRPWATQPGRPFSVRCSTAIASRLTSPRRSSSASTSSRRWTSRYPGHSGACLGKSREMASTRTSPTCCSSPPTRSWPRTRI